MTNSSTLIRSKNLHRLMTAWYRKHRRELQWRHTTDPYEILVSEIMLQQTQVNRVKEKLPVFLKRFPSLTLLAKASRADVLHAWRGMGYNNRAVRIHKLAQIVSQEHNGKLPNNIETLLDLPGIGPYTAHALSCFGFHRRVPVVDVNIRRVLSRMFWKMNSIEDYKPEGNIWSFAFEVLPQNAFLWNQALMDLGATICTARTPACPACPVQRYCQSNDLHRKIRRTMASKKRGRPEPVYEGIPRRIWRGKIVDVLRDMNSHEKISLPALGKAIKHDFSRSELPWLEEIVDRLSRDGLLAIRRGPAMTYVSFVRI